MELTTAPATPASLEEVRALFENWRQNRKKLAPIPETLWEAAAALYPSYSLHRIAKTLHLNHTKLKHYARPEPSMQSRAAAEDFIELDSPACAHQSTVDMQHVNGSRMRVENAGSVEVIELARLFWSRP
jgi:hypothetical protein